MIVLTLPISQRVYHIPYEYGRIAKVVLVACILSALKGVIVPAAPLLARISMKAVLLMLFPLALYLMGFFENDEIAWIRDRFATLVKGRAWA
jgi:hypothetical protein